jgi:hypothetical protein
VGVATGASGGRQAARCTSNGFLCAISAACGNQQKKRHAFMELFHLGWRDSLGIKNPAFWCISVRTPPALHRFVERCHHLAAMSDGKENALKAADQVDDGVGQAAEQKAFMQ